MATKLCVCSHVKANVYVREQEVSHHLSHALLPVFALASVSVADCHVCVRPTLGCALSLHMGVHKRKGTAGKAKRCGAPLAHVKIRTERK